MKCRFCGEEFPEDAAECPNCGCPAEPEASGLPKRVETDDASSGSGEQEEPQPYQYGSSEQRQEDAYRYQYTPPGQGQQASDRYQYQYGSPGQGDHRQPGGGINGTPYMIFAVITTMLCCLPLGIAAIVYASRINTLQRNGDYAGAQDAAKKARLFSVIGTVSGVIVTIMYIVGFMIGIKGYEKYTGDRFPFESEFRQFYEEGSGNGIEDYIEEREKDDDWDADGDKDGFDDDEFELDAAPAEAQAELGEQWDTFTAQINDKVIAFPCAIEDLEDAGLRMDEDEVPEDYIVNAGEHVSTYFEDRNDNYIIVDIVNMTDKNKPIEKCLAGGITVMDYSVSEGGLTVILPGEIRIGTEENVVLEKYGKTDDIYEGDNIHTYTWYDKDEFRSKCEIETDAQSRRVTSMSIKNFEE